MSESSIPSPQSDPTQSDPTQADAGPSPDETAAKGPWHYLWQTVSWLLLAAAVAILAATIVVPKVAGAQPYTVLTGSMQPDYPPGSLIVVKPRPADEITPGDVITYQIRSGDPEVVTHRVVEVTRDPEGQRRFIAQGDANSIVDDEPVRPVQVRGVLWYSIPYLGYVNTWFTGNRRTVTVFVLAGLLFAYAAWQIYRGFREDREKPEKPDEPETAESTERNTDTWVMPTPPDPADAPTEPIPPITEEQDP